MNSFSILGKSVARAASALVAVAILLLAMGCGGSGSFRSLGGGFSNASLNGQYVITLTGIGVNQSVTASDAFSETIVLTADGNRNLSVKVDDFDQSGSLFGLVSTLSGSYTINSDGTGSLSFNSSNYAITMIDDSHFYVIEGDGFATASGFGEKQDTTAFSAPPAHNFVFKTHKLSASSRVGGITIAASNITGTEDRLNLGFLSTSAAISSTTAMSTPDSNGRGTFVLADGTSFFYYVVNSKKFYLLSNSGSLEIGQAEAQSAGPFSPATLAANSSYVFGSSGDTSFPVGIHSAGVFSSDGNGNITGGAVDYVQDSTLNSNLPVSGGNYTLTSNGRGQINLTLTGGTIGSQIFWMVDGTRAYFLVDSAAAVEDGTFTVQTGAPFSNNFSSHATFVMDGFDSTYKDRVGAFAPTSSGNFNWSQAANAFDAPSGTGITSSLATNGTYTVSSNGRVAVTVNGVTNNLVFYLSSPNTGFMVQEDADIGGAFTAQASQ